MDYGILWFAILVNFYSLAGWSYRTLIPLFIGDPIAALVGKMVQQKATQADLPSEPIKSVRMHRPLL